MTDTERRPINIRPEALLMALACAAKPGGSRPQLERVYLDPDGYVVATNGHIASCFKDGWDNRQARDGAPAERAGGWVLSGDLRGLVAVAKAAARSRRACDVFLFPNPDPSWRAVAHVGGKHAPGPVTVAVEADGPDAQHGPYVRWRQVFPAGEKVTPCTVAVDTKYMTTIGQALRGCGARSACVRLYTTGEERAIVLRSDQLPDWTGVLMPVRPIDFPGWDAYTAALFLQTHTPEQVERAQEAAA